MLPMPRLHAAQARVQAGWKRLPPGSVRHGDQAAGWQDDPRALRAGTYHPGMADINCPCVSLGDIPYILFEAAPGRPYAFILGAPLSNLSDNRHE